MERQDGGALTDWNKEDKLNLYHAIKMYGSHNIEEIQENIPGKTKEDIEEAIYFFKNKALKQEDCRIVKDRSRESNRTHVPLNSWAKLLTETFPFEELRTETATALRLIADFENLPQPVVTEKIDFRNVYHSLANALEGKALCEDKLIASVLDKCLIETALTNKAFMKGGSYTNAVKDIRINDRDISPFIKPTDNNELSIIRSLAMTKNYNPLNISEEHLKVS